MSRVDVGAETGGWDGCDPIPAPASAIEIPTTRYWSGMMINSSRLTAMMPCPMAMVFSRWIRRIAAGAAVDPAITARLKGSSRAAMTTGL